MELGNLQLVDLSNNRLTGTIPVELKAPLLEQVQLQGNSIHHGPAEKNSRGENMPEAFFFDR